MEKNYESYHARISEISEQLRTRKADMSKSLEAMIELRADMIRDFPSLNPEQRQLLYMQTDNLDRLFSNVFELERIKTADSISKQYNQDEEI